MCLHLWLVLARLKDAKSLLAPKVASMGWLPNQLFALPWSGRNGHPRSGPNECLGAGTNGPKTPGPG